MCKKFYVEVTGLGDDGEQQLVSAGIRKDSIMVIEENDELLPLKQAIESATGYGFDAICGKDRSRNVMIARLIFVHFASVLGIGGLRIMDEIHKNKTMFRWYCSQYDSGYKYDRVFRRAADNVKGILGHDPRWRPTTLVENGTGRKHNNTNSKQQTTNNNQLQFKLKL